ncbi:DNA adenine methylase [Acinetobacter baumannii]|uniref:DNA adenine methylase n=1 Tax=Acinetobacter baumannii TaxID=470 RepID=UPI002AB55674|nr:Dam family site-specific DNA-(adenine-N6)-methyltransferase [Acinetobacter baumannii]
MHQTSFKYEVKPFLKWAGGKRWFVNKHLSLLPQKFNTYIEPFLGSGALFFNIQPTHAIINDVNPKLIEVYKAIKIDPLGIENRLKVHHEKHSKEYYYYIRSLNLENSLDEAAKFIYLNRTCFNGIYRVNLKGEFNVPIGTKDQVLLECDNFQKVSECLQNVDIYSGDFERIIDMANEGDFLFIDPPYTVSHNNNGFIKYNENLFSWDDQIRLHQSLKRAHKRKVKILCTNANHQSIHDLYKEKYFQKHIVSRYSAISGKRSARNQYEEIVIRNYK